MEPKKKINTSNMIVLIFIGIVILGVIGYMVFQYVGGESDGTPTESTVSFTEEETEEITEEPATEPPTEEPTEAPTEAPTEPPTEPPTEAVNAAWKEPYINYINSLSKDFLYRLVYVDGDDTPELFAVAPTALGGYEICTYYQGQFVSEHLYSYDVYYIEKSGLILNSGGRGDVHFDRVYRLKEGSIQLIHEGCYGPSTDYDIDSSGLLGSDRDVDQYGNLINRYVWDGQYASQSEYNQGRNSAFDPNTSMMMELNLLSADEAIEMIRSMS